MKMLETKQEIAIAINMHEMPVVRIDLADADEYGIKSQKVLIDNGKFRRLNPTDPDMPYLVRAEIRAFVDVWCWQSWTAAGRSHTSRSSYTRGTALTRTVKSLSDSPTRTTTQPNTSGPPDAVNGNSEAE